MGEVPRKGRYLYVKSAFADSLKPNETSKHDVTFTLLHTLEFDLEATWECPEGLLTYKNDEQTWTIKKQRFGGLSAKSRTATFKNDATLAANVSLSEHSAEQSLHLTSKVRCDGGAWLEDVALDHPFTIRDA